MILLPVVSEGGNISSILEDCINTDEQPHS